MSWSFHVFVLCSAHFPLWDSRGMNSDLEQLYDKPALNIWNWQSDSEEYRRRSWDVIL